MSSFIRLHRRLKNLLDLMILPSGFHLKFAEPSFNQANLEVCVRLQKAGVRPMGIVDVGANIGQFAVAATTVWPEARIWSFEPNPAAYDSLCAAAKRHPNILPMNLALGEIQGTIPFRITSANQSSSFLQLHKNHLEEYPDVVETKTISVPVSTLNVQDSSLFSSRPSLLKLDVQGYEKSVLAGAGDSLQNFQWILLETSTRPMYEGETLFTEMLKYLEQKGFRFISPVHLNHTESGKFAQFDALFEKAT